MPICGPSFKICRLPSRSGRRPESLVGAFEGFFSYVVLPWLQAGENVGAKLAQEIMDDELFEQGDLDGKPILVKDDMDEPGDCILLTEKEWQSVDQLACADLDSGDAEGSLDALANRLRLAELKLECKRLTLGHK